MNVINVTIDFEKGICRREGISVVTGDYNSTKVVFEFNEEATGTKMFKMNNPSNELVYADEIINNEVILVGTKEENGETTTYSLFGEEGDYTFEVALYQDNGRITSVYDYITATKEQVIVDGEVVEEKITLFDSLMNDIAQRIEETNNLDLKVEKVDTTTTVTITKKDGTTKEVEILDGETGATGRDATINGVNTLTIVEGSNIGISQDGSTMTINNTYDDSSILADISDLRTNKADKSEIPTKTSDITNDSGYITNEVNDLTNYTKTSDLGAAALSNDYDDLNNKPDLSVYATNESLSTEVTNRQNSDIALQGQIDAITSASDVVDVVSTYQELENYDTSKLTDKDVIKVMQDSTHSNALSYYRWNTSTFDYVGSEGPFYTKGEADTLLLDKVGFTDYTSDNKAGVIKTRDDLATGVNADGSLRCKVKTNNEYNSLSDSAFIGKRTLENVITGKGLVKNTDYATSSTGGVIKVSNGVASTIDNYGTIYPQTKTYSDYTSGSNNMFIGKGTLENVITGKNLESANNKVTSISEDSTDTQYPSAKAVYDSQEEQNEEIDRLKKYRNALIEVENEGTSVTLNDTAECPLEIALKGNTSQESTTGKNLLPVNSQTLVKGSTRTKQINFATPIPAGTYTLSAKITNKSGLTTEKGMGWALFNGSTNVAQFSNILSDTTSPYSNTKTITEQATHLYMYINIDLEDTATITLDEMMIESGSSATTYEPYTNGASPNPDYPQEVEVVSGDNTINVSNSNLANLVRSVGTYTGSGTQFNEYQYFTNMARDSGVGSSVSLTSATNDTIVVKARYNQGIGFPRKCKPNTYYSLQATSTSTYARVYMSFFDNTGTFISGSTNDSSMQRTQESPANAYWVIPIFAVAGNLLVDTTFTNILLEESNTINTYYPYQSQTYNLSLGNIELCKIGDYQDDFRKSTGKNLWNLSTSYSNTGSSSVWVLTDTSYSIPAGTYTISCKNNNSTDSVRFNYKYADNTESYVRFNTKGTFTITEEVTKVAIQLNANTTITDIQLEKGTSATEYEPFGIVWCKHKEIGKGIFNGTEQVVYYSVTQGSLFRVTTTFGAKQNIKYYSEYYIGATNSGDRTNNSFYYNNDNKWDFVDNRFTSADDFKTWLGTHNTTAHYVLSTPTNEPITDTNLINQLDELEKAMSYNNQTNISQTNSSKPFILKASAIYDLRKLLSRVEALES